MRMALLAERLTTHSGLSRTGFIEQGLAPLGVPQLPATRKAPPERLLDPSPGG
ncbi:hypothetical protein ABH931_002107 [Streptacidiphilus sp. MAP12-33]